MKRLALMMAASAALATAGCSLLGRAAFEQPVVKLKDVKLAGVGVMGGNLDVVLSVYNPNHYRLDATKLTYQVNLAGDSVNVASGELTDKFTVQDNATQDVVIPVSFTYLGLGAAGRSILNTGAVNYHVLGEVSVGTTVGTFKVPYSSTGRFAMSGVTR
ncbi:MAG TPA: LEA type 2 family protein [Gemmatimonadaceae bacterium]|nr:LEA type 2 family protein [Gemmatimonadaceae bacterium]